MRCPTLTDKMFMGPLLGRSLIHNQRCLELIMKWSCQVRNIIVHPITLSGAYILSASSAIFLELQMFHFDLNFQYSLILCISLPAAKGNFSDYRREQQYSLKININIQIRKFNKKITFIDQNNCSSFPIGSVTFLPRGF